MTQQNKLFVGNLAFNLNESDLRDAFKQFGQISEINLIIDRETGRSRGFCFITFEDHSGAQKALALNNQELKGRKIVVNFADSKKSGSR